MRAKVFDKARKVHLNVTDTELSTISDLSPQKIQIFSLPNERTQGFKTGGASSVHNHSLSRNAETEDVTNLKGVRFNSRLTEVRNSHASAASRYNQT